MCRLCEVADFELERNSSRRCAQFPKSPKDQTEADERLDAWEIDDGPFGDIVAALEYLSADKSLLLVNSFEPEPLYEVLASVDSSTI